MQLNSAYNVPDTVQSTVQTFSSLNELIEQGFNNPFYR